MSARRNIILYMRCHLFLGVGNGAGGGGEGAIILQNFSMFRIKCTLIKEIQPGILYPSPPPTPPTHTHSIILRVYILASPPLHTHTHTPPLLNLNNCYRSEMLTFSLLLGENPAFTVKKLSRQAVLFPILISTG